MHAFDSDLPPIVGQQVTLNLITHSSVADRIDLLIDRARTPFVSKILGPGARECDLVVKGRVLGVPVGWLFDPVADRFIPDVTGGAQLTDGALRLLGLVPGQALTFTCVPSGSGTRIALDRDEDGFLNRDELAAGTDPADPSSHP